MSEFMYDKEKYIEEGKKIIFENNTDSSFDVETGIVFHKSGLYDVDISNNHVVISKVDERKVIEEAYQKGFEAGQHEATTLEYQQGLDDVWETIIKLAHTTYAQRSEIFDGLQDILSIMQKFSPSEVIAKLKAYEEQQKPDEIKVGDWAFNKHVSRTSSAKVTCVDGQKVYILYDDGSCGFADITDLEKTNVSNPKIEQLLEMLKGEQRNCYTCKHKVISSIECVDCRGFGKWEPKGVTE